MHRIEFKIGCQALGAYALLVLLAALSVAGDVGIAQLVSAGWVRSGGATHWWLRGLTASLKLGEGIVFVALVYYHAGECLRRLRYGAATPAPTTFATRMAVVRARTVRSAQQAVRTWRVRLWRALVFVVRAVNGEAWIQHLAAGVIITATIVALERSGAPWFVSVINVAVVLQTLAGAMAVGFFIKQLFSAFRRRG